MLKKVVFFAAALALGFVSSMGIGATASTPSVHEQDSSQACRLIYCGGDCDPQGNCAS